MIEKLKALALQKLQEKMAGNSLNPDATNEAASEGVSALFESIQGGDLSQITALFGGAEGADSNNLMSNLQGKLGEILQQKGMSAEEAQNESQNTAADLVSGLKEKFQSSEAADSDFDLSQITGLLGGLGGGGSILDKAKSAGNILNAAKNMFGK